MWGLRALRLAPIRILKSIATLGMKSFIRNQLNLLRRTYGRQAYYHSDGLCLNRGSLRSLPFKVRSHETSQCQMGRSGTSGLWIGTPYSLEDYCDNRYARRQEYDAAIIFRISFITAFFFPPSAGKHLNVNSHVITLSLSHLLTSVWATKEWP